MAAKIQIRRDTAANWTTINPVLSDGEQGFEKVTNKVKVGDGVKTWNLLPYLGTTQSTNDKGFFPTEADLIAAIPVGEAGWFAVVGETDTIWVWDVDTTAWVDSGAIPSGLASDIHGATEKGSIEDNDEIPISNSALGAWGLAKVKWSTLKNNIKAFLDPTYLKDCFSFALSDYSSDIELGTRDKFNMPYACTLTDLFIAVATAPTGASLIVDLHKNGVSIFTTLVSIDAGTLTSITAVTPYVLTGTITFVKGDLLTAIVTQRGATIKGAGLKGYLNITRT